jgi:hypothetical protein
MTGVAAGRMDRRIVLQKAPAVQSESGELSFDWDHATATSVSAEWLPEGTTEAWQSSQRLASYVSGVFKIYDRDPRPTPDDTRILFEGKTYDLKPVIEIGRREGLLIPVVARGE